jgi:hypothetical protein
MTNDQAGTNGGEDVAAAQRVAAQQQREALAERTIVGLRDALMQMLREWSMTRIKTVYGDLLNIGVVSGAIVLAADDGRAFNIAIHYDDFVGQTRWQQIATARANELHHEPGPWEYAASLGYISTCQRCGGMMATGMDKRPHGEQFSRRCFVTASQQRMDLDYDPTSEDDV